MKKKTPLLIIILGLINPLALHAASAPFYESEAEGRAISHRIEGAELKITNPNGAFPLALDISKKPLGEEDDDDDMTIKTFMRSAHKSGQFFCFILGKIDNQHAVVRTDHNFYYFTSPSADFIELRRYQLKAGGTGLCFPKGYTPPAAAREIIIQHVPVLCPVGIGMPYPVAVPTLYPVYLQSLEQKSSTPLASHPGQTAPVASLKDHTSKEQLTNHTQKEIGLQVLLQELTAAQKQQEKTHAAEVAQKTVEEKILQEKRDAELAALTAAQEANAAEELEKIRAIEATQKAEQEAAAKKIQKEEAKLRKIEKKTRQAEQEKQDKETKAQQRAEQAQRDRETSARQKAEQETAEQQKKATANKAQKEGTKAVQKKPRQPKSKGAAAADDDDDALLEREMARVAALQSKTLHDQKTPQQATETRKEKISKLAQAGRAAAGAAAQFPDLTCLEDPIGEQWDTFSFDEVDTITRNSKITKEEALVNEFFDAMTDKNHTMAKKLLEKISPKNKHYPNLLAALYAHAPLKLFTQEEFEHFIREQAPVLVKDKSIDSWSRCVLFFALAMEAKDNATKEEYLDRCIALDKNIEQIRARALKRILELQRIDSIAPICKASGHSCIHTDTFDTYNPDDDHYNDIKEVKVLKDYLQIKGLSDSCPQLVIKSTKGIEEEIFKREIIDYYNKQLGESQTKSNLTQICMLILVEQPFS